MHEAEKVYARFATASPIERLSVKPNIPEELISGKWSRVNSGTTSMLYQYVLELLHASHKPDNTLETD